MGNGENPHKKREAEGRPAGLEDGITAVPVLPGLLAFTSAWYRRSMGTVAGFALYRIRRIGVLVAPAGITCRSLSCGGNIYPLITLYTHGGPMMAVHLQGRTLS
jgi:hypothetical protein